MYIINSRSIARYCCIRVKRTLFLSIFLTITSCLIISIFYVLNQDHAQFSVLRERLRGGRGMGPEHADMLTIHKQISTLHKDSRQGGEPNQRPMYVI